MKNNFYGDQSVWATGIVEDVNDPLRAGRVRVRIYGLHSEDDTELPTSELPWSQIALSPTSGGISGLGTAPVGLVKGSMVHGKFLDGHSKQNFMVTGVIIGMTKRSTVQGEIQEGPELVGNTNPEKAYNYLRSKNFTDNEASGIVAAIQEYTSDEMDPTRFYDDGFGIGLWTEDELLALREYALRRDSLIEDLETQLEYLVETMPLRGWPNILTESGKTITPSTSTEAAQGFIQKYYSLDTEKVKDSVEKKATEIQKAYGTAGGTSRLPKRVPPSDLSFGDHVTSMEQLYALFISVTREISELIVHHADTYENMDTDVHDIDSWHRDERGFDAIGYHFIIRRDGRIQYGRDINIQGAHAKNRNPKSVGISFIGGRVGHSSDRGLVRSSDTFTDAQWESFDKFIGVFLAAFPDCNTLGHRDVDPTRRSDPEFDVREYVRSKKPQWVAPSQPSPSQTIEEVEVVEVIEAENTEPRKLLNPVKQPQIIIPVKTAEAPTPELASFTAVERRPFKIKTSEVSSQIPSPFEDPITTIAGRANPLSFETKVPTADIEAITNNLLIGALGSYVLADSITDVVRQPTLADYALLSGANFAARPTLNGVDIATVDQLAGSFDTSANYVMTGQWEFTQTPIIDYPVTSVASKTGDVILVKADVGLANVDNTSDVNKPVSAAQQSALDLKLDQSEKGIADGIATLNSSGKLTSAQVPAIAITETTTVNNIAERDLLTAQEGDVAIVLDDGNGFTITQIFDGAGQWQTMVSPGLVTSVAGQTGTVVLSKADIGLANVDNTSDVNKPVSAAQQSALDLKLDSSNYTAADVLAKLLTVDGSTSNLDADKLDGLDGAAYAKLSGLQTFDDDIYLANELRLVAAANEDNFIRLVEDGSTRAMFFNDASLGNLRLLKYNDSGSVTADLHLRDNGTVNVATGELQVAGNTVFHAGNDGAGSTMDADLLDGQQGAYYLDYNNFVNTPATPSQGSGGGFDADTVDSLHATSFLRSDASDTFSGAQLTIGNQTQAAPLVVNGTVSQSELGIRRGNSFTWYMGINGSSDFYIRRQDYTQAGANLFIDAQAPLFRIGEGITGLTFGGNTVWTSANDGSGSSLDADTVDGQEGAYYLDYTNFTNTPALDFMPLSGGTMTGNLTISSTSPQTLYIENDTSTWGRLVVTAGSGYLQVGATGQNNLGSGNLFISGYSSADVGIFQVRKNSAWNDIWHAGNDGSGSGLDADTVDGYDAGQFLKEDTGSFLFRGDSANGYMNFTHGNTTRAGYVGFHLPDGTRTGYIGWGNGVDQILLTSENGHYYNFNVVPRVASNVVWHAGNDGSGSGLDADTLDGFHASSSSFANYIAVRDGASDVSARLFRSTFGDGDVSGSGSAVMMRNNTTDNYLRPITPANFITWLGNHDGAGSGLDADTVDGVHVSTIMQTNVSQNISAHHEWQDGYDIRVGTSADMRIRHVSNVNYIDLYTGNLLIRDGSTTRFTFGRSTGDLNATSFTATSDARLKENVTTAKPLDVDGLRFVNFNWKENDVADYGFIAQEVEKVLPQFVKKNESTGMLGIDYTKLNLAMIQSLREDNKKSNARIEALENTLMTALDAIEKLRKQND